MIRLLTQAFVLSLCVAVGAAQAVERKPHSEPVVYSRGTLTIYSAPKPVEPETKEEPKAEKANDSAKVIKALEPAPKEVTPVPHDFNVDIRPLSTLYSSGYFTMSEIGNHDGLLFLIDPPSAEQLGAANLFASVDVLFINDVGVITQIFPDVILSKMQNDMIADKPIRAVLLLSGGNSVRNNIRPGDTVKHAIFKTPVKVIK